MSVNELPTPSIDELGKIYRYIGESDEHYIYGYYYKCISDGNSESPTYTWKQITVNNQIQYLVMPEASEDLCGLVVQYVGQTVDDFTKGDFYECVSDGQTIPTYNWSNILSGGGVDDNTLCEFVNLSEYVACVGAQLNIYFDNISKTKNNANIYFTATSSNNNIPITILDNCLRITPTVSNVGTSTITLKARRKDSGGQISSTTFTLRVVNKTSLSRSVRVMLIGDSITNGGWNYNLPNMMNITFYGTLGTSPRNHEGRVSWKAVDYCTKQSYNNYTNPFYNPNKSGTIKFDFAYYMTNHPSFANVDYVNIMLGRNDGYTDECIQYIKAMVDDILSYNNNIRVTVSYGFQKGYQLWEKDQAVYSYSAKLPIFTFDGNLRTTFSGYSRVDLIPTFVNSDNIYDHGEANHSISNRNTVFKYPVYVSDGVHFITQGYYKIGDVYFNYLNYLTSKYPLPDDPSVVDKTVLQASILSANTLLNNTHISVDGTDVPNTEYWCTQAECDTYYSAISAAQSVYNDDTATQTQVDDEVTVLESATTTFNSERQLGSGEPSVVRPNSALYYTMVHNITQDNYYYTSYQYGDTYKPTAVKLVRNSGNNKWYVVYTMSGTPTAYAFLEYTSDDGHTWSSSTQIKNSNQFVIPNTTSSDDVEIIEKNLYVQ